MDCTYTVMPKKTNYTERIIKLLGSSMFFWAIVTLLVLQAVWIALSGRYPMAFDEDFHLGIIRLYAHHISPFWSNQPEGADMFGAVGRDPSYLYHYLMSFPYRLISLFTASQTIQVLILRFINIGLFAGGLVLYRRLLLKTGVSKAIAHTCLLIFVLLPIVPLLAAQINYDNLLMPMVALILLLATLFDASLARKKQIDVKTFILLAIVGLLASLVKYAFLPILVAIAGFIIVRLWQSYRSISDLRMALLGAWRELSKGLRLGLVALLVLSAGLVVERYGLNTVHYHTPLPDCSKVLSVEQCREYGPWIRDYDFEAAKAQSPRSPLTYAREWLYEMWFRTFFAVDGPASDFETRGPLTVPALSAIGLIAVSSLALPVTALRLFKKYNTAVLWLFFAVTAVYISVLWVDGYRAFLRTGQPVAINGRYLLPVLLPVFVVAAAAINELIRKWRTLKLVVLTAAVLCIIWGGGALTYILRSSDAWYWPNGTVHSANNAVKRTLGPVTPGYYRPTQYLR